MQAHPTTDQCAPASSAAVAPGTFADDGCAAITVATAQEGTETLLRGLAPKRAVIAAFFRTPAHNARHFSTLFSRLIAGLALFCSFGTAVNAEELSAACPLLTPLQVSTILGLRISSNGVATTRKGNTTTCQFKADGRFAEVRISNFSTESAAMKSYQEALADLSRGASGSEPLHGVGTESRLLLRNVSTIVARYGIHLVIVTTDGNRGAVVGLARAAGAKFALPTSHDANSEAQ